MAGRKDGWETGWRKEGVALDGRAVGGCSGLIWDGAVETLVGANWPAEGCVERCAGVGC